MATFAKHHGDILDSQAQVLVNPVNCRGTMGAGLARQFRDRYPGLETRYRRDCRTGLLRPGRVTLHQVGPSTTVANLPTKDDWRAPSRMEWVEEGLDALAKALLEGGFSSVAVPALGAGLGGLPWPPVEQAVKTRLDASGLTVELYPPRRAPRA